jgi:hypothetical protein
VTRNTGDFVDFGSAQDHALVKLNDSADSDAENANAKRKTFLKWCGIGLGVAIIVPLFLYFAPHVF